MKYAIISDIHGNIHAFNAVLADAKAQNVDMYLLIGDYASSFPFGNDVVNTLRSIKSATVVRGNGEDYFLDLQKRNPKELTHEQFKPLYWAYHSLSPENLEYLASLPAAATILDNNIEIHLAHAMNLFYRTPSIKLFYSNEFRKIMAKCPLTHEEYLVRARDALITIPGVLEEIDAMSKGVYLFGHNHLQFHMEYEGRIFINPGSCGESLNWKPGAAYSILTVSKSGWAVDERHVAYDLNLAAEGLRTSGYAEYAPIWSSIMERQLFTAQDHFFTFVLHIIETGRKMGCTTSPVSNDVWDAAVKTWSIDKIYE